MISLGNGKYSVRALKMNMQIFEKDPLTKATEYWPVAAKLLLSQSSNPEIKNKIYDDNNVLSNGNKFEAKEISNMFGFDPTNSPATPFNQNRQFINRNLFIREAINKDFIKQNDLLDMPIDHLTALGTPVGIKALEKGFISQESAGKMDPKALSAVISDIAMDAFEKKLITPKIIEVTPMPQLQFLLSPSGIGGLKDKLFKLEEFKQKFEKCHTERDFQQTIANLRYYIKVQLPQLESAIQDIVNKNKSLQNAIARDGTRI